jgi:hypothetical protein
MYHTISTPSMARVVVLLHGAYEDALVLMWVSATPFCQVDHSFKLSIGYYHTGKVLRLDQDVTGTEPTKTKF